MTDTGIATAVTSLYSTDVTFEVLYGKQKHTCQLTKLVTVEILLQMPPFMPHLALGTSRALAVRFEEIRVAWPLQIDVKILIFPKWKNWTKQSCTCYATQFPVWVRMEKQAETKTSKFKQGCSAECREKGGDKDINLTTHWSTVHRPLSFPWEKVAICQEQHMFIFPLVKSFPAAAWSSLQQCRPACWTPPFAASWQAVIYPHQPNHWYFHCHLPK